MSLEASSAANRAEITRLRNKLLAHWLGCVEEPMVEAIDKWGSVGAALEALRQGGFCRLRPIVPEPLNPIAAFIAAFHLGDPVGPRDSWRPWKRGKALEVESERVRRATSKGAAAETPRRAGRKPARAKPVAH